MTLKTKLYDTDYVLVDSKTKKPMEGYEIIYHYTSVINDFNEMLMEEGCEYVSIRQTT